MADIATDRAWMSDHAVRQAAENAEADRQRQRREREEHARMCWFCFHAAHVIDYGSTLIDDLTVLHCRTDGCVCGVPPCTVCGSRTRGEHPRFGMERCDDCGAEWQGAVYA